MIIVTHKKKKKLFVRSSLLICLYIYGHRFMSFFFFFHFSLFFILIQPWSISIINSFPAWYNSCKETVENPDPQNLVKFPVETQTSNNNYVTKLKNSATTTTAANKLLPAKHFDKKDFVFLWDDLTIEKMAHGRG